MEIRQKDAARDMENRDINLRSTGSDSIRSGFTSGERNSSRSPDDTSVNKSSSSGYGQVQQTLTPEETRELIAQLSPEERKQWNSYSNHEKQKLLKDVERNVDRKMRLRPQTVVSGRPTGNREQTTQAYRREETGQRTSVNRGRTSGSIRQTNRDKIDSYVERTSSGAPGRDGQLQRNKAYVRTAAPKIREAGFKRGSAVPASERVKENQDRESGVTAYRNLMNAQERNPSSHRYRTDVQLQERVPKNKMAQDEMRRSETSQDRMRQNETFRKEMRTNEISQDGMRQNETSQVRTGRNETGEDSPQRDEMRRKEPAEGMSVRQSDKSFRETPKEDLNEKREEKQKKEEHSERKKEFFNEFEHTLSQDSRKRQNINNAIKEEQISQTELEYETGADALRTATTPIRAGVSQGLNRVRRRITSAAAGFLKYAALFGGIFLLFMLLIMFIAALLGGLAGEEADSSSTMYTANGQEIVEYAKEWIGITKYVWGYGRNSETDWQDYADCSSFVHGVYSHFGIQLGWDTYAMESNGEVLEGGISEAMPGDIILYYSGSIAPNQSSHVAIYAGDGEVVHCSGGRANTTPATAGRGVCISTVEGAGGGRPYEVRRVISNISTGTGGYNIDPTNYTMEELELIWAIVNQEDNGSYEGALAVISTAMNRVDSPQWSALGSNALEQLTAPGQFCYSIDNNWRQWLGGNVQSYVIQAVSDCLNGGIRNHNYTSFRSYYVEGSEQIGGGNYYF